MAFPINKGINTELFVHGRVELYIQKWGANFLANLKRVIVGVNVNN